MNVQITIQVEGREVQTLQKELHGDAAQREEQAHLLGKQAARVVAENALQELADTHPASPCCCRRTMSNRGYAFLTMQGLDGPLRVRRKR